MLRSLFGLGPKVDLTAILQQGATILDVRTPAEIAQGHVNKPVITCCKSGARSGMAESILRKQGFEAYNGGPWTSVQQLKG